MQFNEITFTELDKESYLTTREIIRTKLEETRGDSYACTAWHKLYNALRGKPDCHEITKSHQDRDYHKICLGRAWKELQESLEEAKSQEASNAGSPS